MKELKPIEESWNKKRIFFALTILVILIAGLAAFKVLALDKNQVAPEPVSKKAKSVEGVSTNVNSLSRDSTSPNLKTNIEDQLNAIKQEASGINLAEVATSSPQIQKVIDDIKSIQNLPKDKVKDFCEQICSGL